MRLQKFKVSAILVGVLWKWGYDYEACNRGRFESSLYEGTLSIESD